MCSLRAVVSVLVPVVLVAVVDDFTLVHVILVDPDLSVLLLVLGVVALGVILVVGVLVVEEINDVVASAGVPVVVVVGFYFAVLVVVVLVVLVVVGVFCR